MRIYYQDSVSLVIQIVQTVEELTCVLNVFLDFIFLMGNVIKFALKEHMELLKFKEL